MTEEGKINSIPILLKLKTGKGCYMLKIGRYGVALGPVLWFQTKVPTRVWHFLCFWFIKEARPNDVDRKQRFPPSTLMEQEGRKFRYWKASEDVVRGEVRDDDGGGNPGM